MIRSSHETECSFEYMDSLFRVEDGVVYWKVNKGSRAKAGNRAGFRCANGYYQVRVDNRRFYVHRVAYLLQTGAWPVGDIDHLYGDKTDNRLEHVRVCHHRENMQNQYIHRDGRVPGVSFRRGKWIARAWVDGRVKHIGTYQSQFEGFRAYVRYLLDHNLPVRQELINASGL